MTIALTQTSLNIPMDRVTRTHRVIFAMTGLLLLAGLIPNFYSWQMTATGMVLSGFIPADTIFMRSEIITLVLAAVIQLGIFLLFNLVPILFKGTSMRWWMKGICLIILLTFLSSLMVISWGYSLFSTTLNSLGDEVSLTLEGKIENSYQALKNTDALIATQYQNHLDTLEKLAYDAARGKDGTNIAKCGAICNGFLRQKLNLSQKYSALSATVVTDLSLREKEQSLPVMFDAIQQQAFPKVVAKAEFYKAFLNELQAADDISFQLESLREQYARLSEQLSSTTGSQRELIAALIKEQFNNYWQGHYSFNSTLLFGLVMAVIPDIVNLVLVFCIFVIMYIDANVLLNRKQNNGFSIGAIQGI